MAVPEFSFTSRAVPVAQIGRPGPLAPADVAWADIGCDVHEITTDTGRGSASDRYAPGTAVITASNVSGWADGTVPVEWSYFADEFNRSGPGLGSHWARYLPLEEDRGADELVLVGEGAEVVAHPVTGAGGGGPLTIRGTWLTSGAAASTVTIGPFPTVEAGDVIWMALAFNYEMDTAYHPSPPIIPGWTDVSNTPSWGVGEGLCYFHLWQHRVQPEEAASAATWTWTATPPVTTAWQYTAIAFGGVGVDAQVNAFGPVSINGDPGEGHFVWFGPSSGLPSTPAPGCVVIRFASSPSHRAVTPIAALDIVEHAAATVGWTRSTLLAVEVDTTTGLPRVWPAGSAIPGRQLDWTSAPVPDGEWIEHITIIVIPGPAPDPDPLPYHGASTALWSLGYDGDQFVDVTVTGLAAPDPLWPTGNADIELILHASETSLAGVVARLHWQPVWGDPDVAGVLSWSVMHRDDTGFDFALAGDDVTVDVFLEPVRFRFEASTVGGFQLFFQGALIGSGPDLDLEPLTGDKIAVFAEYTAGSLSVGDTDQMGPPRFESIVAGSNLPVPILLEPGVRVRIGVHHETFGDRWFFHGYVDGITPVYNPEGHPVSRIDCIDALGEVGRLPLEDIVGYQPEHADERVRRLLDEADWPPALTEINEDTTWMDNRRSDPDRAVELLTQTAESCGGAVYGDPQTGRLVFRRRDWQAWDPDLPPDGYITNLSTPAGVLAACPSTWERTWLRQDMSTRATLTSAFDTRSYSNPDAEARFGVEPYVRTLVCTEVRVLNILGRRQLKLRGPGAFPRVNAVLLDAATSNGALDVMTVATFTLPHRFQCGLVRDGIVVFDRQYLVTGIRHTIARDRWQTRLALDIADVFATKGARWGRGHWGRTGDVWGRSI